MDYLDLIILGLLLLFAYSGFRRGISWVGPSLLGLLVGLLLGAIFAPIIAKAITHDRNVQPLIAIGFFLAIALMIQGIGTAVGFQARLRTVRTRFATWDSMLGAVLGTLGVLAGAWYLGLVFSQSPWDTLDQQITNSAIERSLDSFVPRPPGFLAALQNILRASDFPNPFSSIVNTPPPPVSIPPLVDTAGTRTAAHATSKVVAFGCGGAEAGSSWPLSPGYLVTNAHVVAGSNSVEVDTTDGNTHKATVVFYDPDTDVAVLYAPSVTLAPLPTSKVDPARGTSGAVIGYPGGGDEKVVPAAVRGTEMARGYNIYGNSLVTRDIEVLAAHIIPGNSGGPIVDNNGTVIGLVFAASTTDPNEGYALTMTQIAQDLNAAQGRTTGTATQSCAN